MSSRNRMMASHNQRLEFAQRIGIKMPRTQSTQVKKTSTLKQNTSQMATLQNSFLGEGSQERPDNFTSLQQQDQSFFTNKDEGLSAFTHREPFNN